MVASNRSDAEAEFAAIPAMDTVQKSIAAMVEGVSEDVIVSLRLHFLSIAIGEKPPILTGKMAVMAAQCVSSVLHHFLDGREIVEHEQAS